MACRLLILDTELELGGKEKLIHDFIARVDRRRVEVAVCCLKSGGYFKERVVSMGVPFYDELIHHRFDALAFRDLEGVLRRERTQIVETFAHPSTVIFSFLAKLRSLVKSVVVSYHAVATDARGPVARPYLRPLLRRMDAHIAVAELQKRQLVDLEGLSPEAVRVIYNGVDTAMYRPHTPNERSSVRRSLGLADDHFVFVSVASLKPVKGVDVLLRAVAPLMQARSSVRLVVAGDGRDRAALGSLADSLGIASKVSFLGPRADVHSLMGAADAFVLASRAEALPTVVLEAMATALPVVATRVGGVPEMVEDERSGCLVRAEDAASLTRALDRVVADVQTRIGWGVRGRAIVESRFGVARMCEERTAFFEELLARAPRESARVETS